MLSVRRLFTLAAVVAPLACGGSTAGTTPPPEEDAAHDARKAVDARGKDAHEHDSGADAGSDATVHESGAPDGAHARDAHHEDAKPSKDARALDAEPADAKRPHDGGAKHDASEDARRDGTSPHDARPDVRVHEDGGLHDGAQGDAVSDVAVDAPPPTATTLTLSLPLVPEFSTSTYDYYVRCTEASNSIGVTMTAAPGSTIALKQPVTTTPSVEDTTTITVAANAPIVVDVKTGSKTEQYWVRCLPSNFPPLAMTLHPEAGTPTPGYYLVGDVFSQVGARGYAMILDMNGVPVWYQDAENGGTFDVENLLPGDISFTAAGATFALDNLPGRTSSVIKAEGIATDFHELRALSNGNFLVLTRPQTTGVDLTGLGTLGPDETLIGCTIQEVTPAGTEVWEWAVTDHFDAVKDSTYPESYTGETGTTVDAFHCNAIDVVDDSDDMIVSARNMDTVFYVSRATGAVQWKLGGATFCKDPDAIYLTVEDDPQTQFYRQHDVRLQPDGTITVFDDQTSKPGPARAVNYSLDMTTKTASLVWQYKTNVTSADMGSFRISSDGSRVIGWGAANSGSHAVFTEVTQAGADLLDFYFNDGSRTYRAVKVPTTTFDIDLLRKATAFAGP